MDENNSELYSANSGYYDLPVKEPWVCGKTLYSAITIGSAILIGIAAACFFAPWLFGNAALSATGITLIGAYYAIFAMFAPFVLFCACIHGCSKYNRKLFGERENGFGIADILYAIQAICVAFLKTALIYYLIAIFSSPVVLIIIVLVAANSVFKIFRW